jgi:hypothetical protein
MEVSRKGVILLARHKFLVHSPRFHSAAFIVLIRSSVAVEA